MSIMKQYKDLKHKNVYQVYPYIEHTFPFLEKIRQEIMISFLEQLGTRTYPSTVYQ